MDKIERLLWKKIDGTITQTEQDFLDHHSDQSSINKDLIKIQSLDSGLRTNATLKSPMGFVSRVMSEIQHLSIIPKVNYNGILFIAIGSLSLITLILYLIRNRFDQHVGGRLDDILVHLDFAAYDIGQNSIIPYLAIIPALTILVWIDQTFSHQH